VTVLAAILRFAGLGHPDTLMFDETFYVKDAWTLLNLGYESKWPEDVDVDDEFNSGNVGIFLPDASYVAHPPLGKWLIAIGLALFGAQNPVGWRFSVAVAGTLAVLLLTVIAGTLFRSALLGTLAGGLMAIDGHAIVLSRVTLLDNFVMLFGLLGFACILLDRRWFDRRFGQWERARDPEVATLGPALAWRPWLIAAGVAFGLQTGVKWSGLYFLAGFAIYVLVVDALARRRAGVDAWPLVTIVRQGPLAFVSLIPAALAAYLATYTGWFLTSGGWNRNWIAEGGERWTGLLAWVPDAIQNLWHWHSDIYGFHTALDSSHPYATPAILWPLLARPTQVYYQGSGAGENGCQFGYCAEIVWSIANPLIWYAGIAAAVFLVYRLIRLRIPRDGLILMGVAVGYLPWLTYPTRTMFQFYAIAFLPFLLLALVAVIGIITGRVVDTGREPPAPHRVAMANRGLVLFVGLAVLLSAFFYPLWSGMQVPFWFWQIHVWSPTWV
jgi:dolichyl-phosphate-mannose--protein O-mannosyl transferase